MSMAQERREFYRSIRALGMGNSAVAVTNDESSLLLNPAGLGKLRNFYGTVFDPEIETSDKTVSMYNARAFSQPWTLADAIPAAVAVPGDQFHFRGQLFPSFVARNFGLGLLQKYDVDAVYDSTTARADTFYRNDLGLVLGYNLRLFDGRVKIGFTGRLINRIEVKETAFDTTQALDLPSLGTAGIAKEGTGFGGDIGIMLAAPWTMIPTIGAVLRDAGGTNFAMSSGQRLSQATSRPATVAQDLDVGIALFPIHRNNVRSVWTIEYKGVLTAQNETDPTKLYHGGVEVNFGDLLFVRAGYNQRYWTGGLELASERFQIQLASYGEEVGTAAASKEDRRYLFKVAFRF
ncbi:MAG: hypothetical protein IPK04_08880 [Bdellovibrionales bacterium]|nr:hypothetical protein [Bdellovibrionales bacterium]